MGERPGVPSPEAGPSVVARWLVAAAGAALVASVPLAAFAAASPPVTVQEARCYEHVIELNDLLCLARYTLRSQTADPTPTPQWSTYGTDGVLARLVDTTPSDTVHQELNPPRLDNALVGFYLAAADAPTWADAGIVARFLSNPATFDPVTVTTRAVTFVASTDVDDTKDKLCTGFRDLLRRVEQEDTADSLTAGSLVNNNSITSAGTTLATDAFASAVTVLPACFAVGIRGGGVAFSPTPGALSPTLVAQHSGSATYQAMEGVATDILGFNNVNWFGGIFFTLMGMGAAVVMLVLGLPGVFAGVAALAFILVGALFVAGTFLKITLVVVFILAMGAAAVYARGVPS